MRLTLAEAVRYLETGKASLRMRMAMRDFERIFSFGEERENRLRRYIAVVRAYGQGMAVDAIIAQFDASKTTVLRYARMAGLPRRPRHFPEAVRVGVLRDYRQGKPVAEIAALHNVSPAYVSTLARAEKISRYARGRNRRRGRTESRTARRAGAPGSPEQS